MFSINEKLCQIWNTNYLQNIRPIRPLEEPEIYAQPMCFFEKNLGVLFRRPASSCQGPPVWILHDTNYFFKVLILHKNGHRKLGSQWHAMRDDANEFTYFPHGKSN